LIKKRKEPVTCFGLFYSLIEIFLVIQKIEKLEWRSMEACLLLTLWKAEKAYLIMRYFK